MGIQGLLPLLRSIEDTVHVSHYKGQRVGIDTYCWLHRAVYSCSSDLVLGRANTKYIDFCLKRVNMLLHHGVIPVMIFDGGKLPQKREKEKERQAKRAAHKEKGMQHLADGNLGAANSCFQKAVDITPAMAAKLIQRLNAMNVECIVAPYEADSQLAYLSMNDYVQCVISEDSDLLVFGCKRVLFKMDDAGEGKEIRLKNFGAVTSVSFVNWSQAMIQEMAVLSGCDYLASISGVGLKKAHVLINQFKNAKRAIRHLRFEGRTLVPRNYEKNVELALQTFRHQRVFDTNTKSMVHCTALPSDFSGDTDFLGPLHDDEVAQGIASGRLDPDTLRVIADEPVPEPTSMMIERSVSTPATNLSASSSTSSSSNPFANHFVKKKRKSKSDIGVASRSHKMTKYFDPQPARKTKKRSSSFADRTASSSSSSSRSASRKLKSDPFGRFRFGRSAPSSRSPSPSPPPPMAKSKFARDRRRSRSGDMAKTMDEDEDGGAEDGSESEKENFASRFFRAHHEKVAAKRRRPSMDANANANHAHSHSHSHSRSPSKSRRRNSRSSSSRRRWRRTASRSPSPDAIEEDHDDVSREDMDTISSASLNLPPLARGQSSTAMLAQFSSTKYVSPFLSTRRLTRARSFGDFSFSEPQDEPGSGAEDSFQQFEGSSSNATSSSSRKKRTASLSVSSSGASHGNRGSRRGKTVSTGLERFRFGKHESQVGEAVTQRASPRTRRRSSASESTRTTKRLRGRPPMDFSFANRDSDDASEISGEIRKSKAKSKSKRVKRSRSPDSPLVRAMSSPLSSPLKATLDSFRYAATTPTSTSSRSSNPGSTTSPCSYISEDDNSLQASSSSKETLSVLTSACTDTPTPNKCTDSLSSSSEDGDVEMSPEFPPAEPRKKSKLKRSHSDKPSSSSRGAEPKEAPSPLSNDRGSSSSRFPYSGGIDSTDSSGASPEGGSHVSIFFPKRKASSRDRSIVDSPEVTPQKVDKPMQQQFSLKGLEMVFKYPR